MARPEEERRERRIEPLPERPGAEARPGVVTVMAAPISWSAVWSGLVSVVAVQTLLLLLGAAVGLGGIGQQVGTGALIWSGVSLLIALFVGGYMAGFMSSRIYAVARGAWHGFVLWSLTVTFALILTVIGASGAVGFFGPILAPRGALIIGGVIGFLVLLLAAAAAVLGGIVGGAYAERSTAERPVR